MLKILEAIMVMFLPKMSRSAEKMTKKIIHSKQTGRNSVQSQKR